MISNILIIDDDPDILDLLESILATEGYGVYRAPDGHKALEVFRSRTVDLAITDLNMPGMGGLEVLSEIKRLDADVEVIVLTGNATLENAIQALKENGAFDYLTKPLENIEDLLISVQRAIEKRNLTLENRSLIKGLKAEVEERKNVEELLLQSKTNLQSVFDGIPEPLVMLDRNMAVIVLNRAAKEYAQVSRFQDVLGQSCHEIFARKSSPCENCRLEQAILDNKPVTFERKGLRDPSRIEEVVTYPMQYGEDGERTAIVRISDITDQREIEQQLIRADRLSSLGQLSGGIAHEIRNPLASINLFTDILSDPQKYERSPQEIELFDEIQINIKRIDQIIKRVLDFAKPAVTSSDAVDLNNLIQECMKFWSSQLRKSKIDLQLSLQDALPHVQGDVIGLQQVIHNVVSNAIEALSDGGEIKIGTTLGTTSNGSNHPTVMLQVSDTGPGIPSAQQEDIFNPFFTTKATGTGLGLSISHQIIKRQGGALTFENNPDAGTTFSIELPAARENQG